ncbi:MAG: hypothetical protein D6759_19885 [Chloroflexi bacterium]|nr:MAG: hypothetical protein D6759_19885 [Chloroflexota bacterium]
MAKVIGHLNERATYGEKLVLEKLRAFLPADFYVYVECPITHGSGQRFPDFIVVCNMGVFVLEVKDWVQVARADPERAEIIRRNGKIARERNPVLIAREYALLLQDTLRKEAKGAEVKVPWGYAAVLPNLPAARITQLAKVWGESYLLGKNDLRPEHLTKRLRRTLPPHAKPIKRREIQYVRSVVYPIVQIEPATATTPPVNLDDTQTEIVAEPPRPQAKQEKKKPPSPAQQSLIPTQEPEQAPEELPPLGEEIIPNAAIRLVRGVAGSGKTLVLTRRAQFLAAQYPEWHICVLSYNKDLADLLQADLKGLPQVEVTTFHSLCTRLLREYAGIAWKEPSNPEGWINYHIEQWPIARHLGVDLVSEEIRWIKEVGIPDRQTYLRVKRKGRGRSLSPDQREQVYNLLEAYQAWLDREQTFDWADVPHLVLRAMDEGKIPTGIYDAILIDEAQDFAPAWIKVLKRLLKPEKGVFFLADDPSQGIYRYYSWREKGVHVVGRTRWLRVPYRNTRQIYQAAYEVIRGDEVLRRQLAEGEKLAIVEPDLEKDHLRSGPLPELRRFDSVQEELHFIRSQVEHLLQQGLQAEKIAVFHRRRAGANLLKHHLGRLGIHISTFHAPKGLEFEVVFLSQMQKTFDGSRGASEESLSKERRLVYMAMTRARERLYLNYEGRWPEPLKGVLKFVNQALP